MNFEKLSSFRATTKTGIDIETLQDLLPSPPSRSSPTPELVTIEQVKDVDDEYLVPRGPRSNLAEEFVSSGSRSTLKACSNESDQPFKERKILKRLHSSSKPPRNHDSSRSCPFNMFPSPSGNLYLTRFVPPSDGGSDGHQVSDDQSW
ncbi:hypothetical protein HAX54_031058 [Datura stramonium]|uniref:Uncharacterized protein n=1 Tax=Datura stramonium TaxID=4076 RepID=A0ABS8VBE1_DATST|nr:hypothetical protein [Datura stramonium]